MYLTILAPPVSKFCGFEVEEEMCRWKPSSNHGVVWQRQKGPARGPTDITETGPQAGFEGSGKAKIIFYVYPKTNACFLF